jgi:hypothetical protein
MSSLPNNCTSDFTCSDLAKSACVINTNNQILVSGREPNSFATGQCGCYTDNDCNPRSFCTYTNTTDPGICSCTPEICKKNGYNKCTLGLCYNLCAKNSDCPITTPNCVDGICGCISCPPQLPICNNYTSICTGCNNNKDCFGGFSCINGMCVDNPLNNIYAKIDTLDSNYNSNLIMNIVSLSTIFIILVIFAFCYLKIKKIKNFSGGKKYRK